jgi:hypothetical protein
MPAMALVKIALLLAQMQILVNAVSPVYFKGKDNDELAPRKGVKGGITTMIRIFKVLIRVGRCEVTQQDIDYSSPY